jgi:hypothetical protein
VCVRRHLFDIDLESVYVYGAKGQWAQELLFSVPHNRKTCPPEDLRLKRTKKNRKCIHAPIRILIHDPSAVAADLRQLGYCLATYCLLFPVTASADKEDPC